MQEVPPSRNDEEEGEKQSRRHGQGEEGQLAGQSTPLVEEASEEQSEATYPPSSQPVILEERDVPFVEERPPNFSPYFRVRVHRLRRPEPPQEVE